MNSERSRTVAWIALEVPPPVITRRPPGDERKKEGEVHLDVGSQDPATRKDQLIRGR